MLQSQLTGSLQCVWSLIHGISACRCHTSAFMLAKSMRTSLCAGHGPLLRLRLLLSLLLCGGLRPGLFSAPQASVLSTMCLHSVSPMQWVPLPQFHALSPLPFPFKLVGLLRCLRRCFCVRLLLRLHRALHRFRVIVCCGLLRILFPPAGIKTPVRARRIRMLRFGERVQGVF